jgi:hypothetical protein
MGIGLGITLLVIGAIIYFTGLDESIVSGGLDTVGLILMLGGVLALIMGLVMNAQRTRTQHTTVTERRGGPDVVERRVDEPDYVERRVERRDDIV